MARSGGDDLFSGQDSAIPLLYLVAQNVEPIGQHDFPSNVKHYVTVCKEVWLHDLAPSSGVSAPLILGLISLAPYDCRRSSQCLDQLLDKRRHPCHPRCWCHSAAPSTDTKMQRPRQPEWGVNERGSMFGTRQGANQMILELTNN